MNKKKIVGMGGFGVVLVLIAGCAYYFYPDTINTILGINSAQIDAVSVADLPPVDDASSSLSMPIFDESGTASTSAVKKAPKKIAQQKNDVPASAGVGERASSSQVPANTSSEQNDALSSPSSSIDAGNNSSINATMATSTQPAISSPQCSFPENISSTTRKIILNEIAWMGTPSSSSAEWMELKNNSSIEIQLSGWELLNVSEKIKITFSADDAIAPGGFLLLSRGSAMIAEDAATSATKIYSGDLVNTGDTLALIDPQCVVSDYLDAFAGWPGGNNSTKQTLERDADGLAWHSSALPGGTPGAENSAGPPAAQYKLTVTFEGNVAGATITSDPMGLVCGVSCTGSYASGTRVTLTPSSGPNSFFGGWSGSCSGMATCSFMITANTSAVATFRSMLPAQTGGSGPSSGSNPDENQDSSNTSSTDPDISSLSTGIATSSDASSTSDNISGDSGSSGGTIVAADHILIATVQIAGASSSNDLVKLYNPTAASVDMSGWKLHKKSQTGADYSLKVFPTGSAIAPGQSFVWANSAGGFSDTVGANVSSTETLSADNSVALMDSTGNIIDAVAWGTGTGQYGEGPPYPTSPGANQLLSRRSSDGVMADTDNNTNDFTLQ